MILTGKRFIVWMVLYSPTQTEWAKYGKPNCHYGHELVKQKISSKLSLLKERIRISDITLLTKVCRVKAMVFPVVMDGCESWTIKKAECQRINAFELWYWRRLLSIPWTGRRSNQSILKEFSPECSLEGLILKLKLQYFGYLMQRADSFEKNVMLGKIEVERRRGRQRMRWLDGMTDSMDMSLSQLRSWWWTGRPGVLPSMGSQRVGHGGATELNWKFLLPQEEIPGLLSVHACVRLCDLMDWSLVPSSRGSFPPRDWTCIFYVTCIGRWVFYH